MTTNEKYKLSAYKEISLLSENAQKKIYIVKDEVSDRLFIKKTPVNLDNLEFYKRLACLEHKNLSRIQDIFYDNEEVCIIEEYINGQTLKALLENDGVQPEDRAIGYVIQICDVLIYLHNQNPPIIHRDIKPDNIIWSNDGIIKLIDFDIAREHKKDVNRDTIFMGTKEYAAPEQYGYKQTDCRTDIFSVGVLLHELVTGRLSENNITYSGALRKIITKCIEIDPDKRFQNVSALKKALIAIRMKKHKRSFTAAISVAVLSSIIIIALLFRHNGYIDNTALSVNQPEATESNNKQIMNEQIKIGHPKAELEPPTSEPSNTEPPTSESPNTEPSNDRTSTNEPPNTEPDLYDLFIKIKSYEEKP